MPLFTPISEQGPPYHLYMVLFSYPCYNVTNNGTKNILEREISLFHWSNNCLLITPFTTYRIKTKYQINNYINQIFLKPFWLTVFVVLFDLPKKVKNLLNWSTSVPPESSLTFDLQFISHGQQGRQLILRHLQWSHIHVIYQTLHLLPTYPLQDHHGVFHFMALEDGLKVRTASGQHELVCLQRAIGARESDVH